MSQDKSDSLSSPWQYDDFVISMLPQLCIFIETLMLWPEQAACARTTMGVNALFHTGSCTMNFHARLTTELINRPQL